MLQILRDKAQSPFIQALVVMIALVFIFWGVGSSLMNNREAALTVNGEEIPFQQFQQAYDRAYQDLANQFGGTVPKGIAESLNLKEQVINQLVQSTLLRQGAQEMGIVVSKEEVAKAINEMVQFQDNGTFSMEKYKAILTSNRLTPKKFEENMSFDMLADKTISSIGNFVTNAGKFEVEEFYRQDNKKVEVNFTSMGPETFKADVVVDEEELAKWYEENSSNYQTEPKTKLQYLSFNFDQVKDKASADSGDEESDLGQSEVEVLTLQLANEAYEKIIGAGSLKAYGEATPDKEIIITDYFTRSAPPAELADDPIFISKAFTLKEGELSSIIKTDKGYFIIFAEAIQPAQTPPLDDVREEVTTDFTLTKAGEKAGETATAFLTRVKSGEEFEAVADELGLTIQESGLIGRRGLEESTFPAMLVSDIFTLSASEPYPDEPGLVSNDYYVYKYAEEEIPEIKEETDVEQYQQALLGGKQQELLSAYLANLEAKAKVTKHTSL